MDNQKTVGIGATQKNGRTPESTATTQANNNIFLTRGQGAYTARKLVSGKFSIHEMMGADKAGNNPYQHIRPLREQGIVVTMVLVPGTDHHEYTVADSVSRAKIKNALFEMSKRGGGSGND